MIDRKAAFQLAIQNEVMSQNLYILLARSFNKKPEISKTFEQLVPMEKLHEEKLRTAFSKEFPRTELDIDNKLSHQLQPADINDPLKVLEFAINREMIAYEVYTNMARESDDKDLAGLFMELATEEDYHRTILETEILRIDGLMTWYDPSELNGLVED